MRKTIIPLMLFLLSLSVCSAASSDNLGTVLDEYKTMSLRFEAGMNYQDFNTAFQNLYVDTRKLQESHPEYKEDLDTLLDTYTDVKALWLLSLDGTNFIHPGGEIYKTYYAKYPGVINSIERTKNDYPTANIISGLVRYSNNQIKDTQKKYTLP